jgi:phosphoesterase RecJ-like protein
MMNRDIVSLINNNQEFILTSHVNPDGDAIGSEIALQLYLKSLGKNAGILNYSPTPDNYTFLDKERVIEQFDEVKHKGLIESADVIFILTESPATGEMLYRFFKEIEGSNGGKNVITSDMALALYTAIMTDTGSFKFNRTDEETHTIVADLLTYGLHPYDIYSAVYNNATLGRLHLLGRFLNNVTMMYDGKLAYSIILQKDFEETSTDEYAIEGFSSQLMSLETVELGIVMTQTKRGVKLSFRSKDKVFSNELAKEFNGGGHKNASGAFVVGGDILKLEKEVTEKAEKYLK